MRLIVTKNNKLTIHDLEKAYSIIVNTKCIIIHYDMSEGEIEVELSKEQAEQLAYYFAVMKNADEVRNLNELLERLGVERDEEKKEEQEQHLLS